MASCWRIDGHVFGEFCRAAVLLPALIYPKLAALRTKMDPEGVCLQQTDYTCGPAAAVTALRRMGFSADEGQMAIWSMTNPYGTTTDDLLNAMLTHYGKAGLSAEFRKFKNVAELEKAEPCWR